MVIWQMTIGIVLGVGWFQGFKLYQGLGFQVGRDLNASLRTRPSMSTWTWNWSRTGPNGPTWTCT
jgi:hypothetical protein